MKLILEHSSKLIILFIVIILFDTIGAHLYSKFTMLLLIIILVNNLKLSTTDTRYGNIIELSD